MFIDISTYIGHWPFRNLRYNTLAGLDTLAQDAGVTHMVVSNINGFFYKDVNAANLELLEELKNYTGKTQFLPLAVVNPLYPKWEKHARALIDAGFVGFELAPQYHGYKLGMQHKYDSYAYEQVAAPVMELARELDVPVRICASIENFRGRGRMDTFDNLTGEDYYALLSKYPEVSVFCTGFAAHGAGEHFSALLKCRDNIFFDVSLGESQLTGIPARNISTAGMEKLCFGSLSPFEYIESALINLEYAPDYDPQRIKTNAARAFRSLR